MTTQPHLFFSSMVTASFVHLRLHSEFSIQDSILTVDGAVAAAVADNMPALALTDMSNLFALVKFYSTARKKGVKPIIGCDVWVADNDQPDKPSRMLLLAQNWQGYHRLSELLTRGLSNQSASWPGHPEQVVVSRAADGWPDRPLGGAVGRCRPGLAERLLGNRQDAWQRIGRPCFRGRYYLEIQRNGRQDSEGHLAQAVALADELELPVVATHTVQFPTRDDFKAHEARVCIAEGYMLADRRRPQDI